METSIVDLRYKTNAVLAAIDNNENVVVLYHGKPKALIQPIRKKNQVEITQHPFFNMCADDEKSVLDELDNLRSGDAIIATTAVENNMALNSSNGKHFKAVADLQLKIFKP